MADASLSAAKLILAQVYLPSKTLFLPQKLTGSYQNPGMTTYRKPGTTTSLTGLVKLMVC